SHDAGATWEQVQVTDGGRYYFAYSGFVAQDGRVTFAEMSETYTAPGGASEGPVLAHAITSDDGGATWTDVVVDQVELGVPCTSEWCYADFYDGHTAIAGDADGDLVMLYDGATRVGGPRRIWARASTDGGVTWSGRVALSPQGANAGFPAAVGFGDGRVRAWFMDQRTGRWNTWYRASRDLGLTWTAAIRISDAISGTAYKDADGFTEVYGDYGEIAITSEGVTVAVWGESISYRGPGGVWFNRQRAG
ncbi:MAG TPA: sialidase family protein, partial [Actinomycetota bacterium]|nr:sialidase family protein [Actinomycetota bacterium]